MTDYSTLLDAETWAFIRETERWYPPDTAEMSVADQRRIYDAMCRAFHTGRPEGITTADDHVGGVPVRRYRASGPEEGPTVLYMHGGGFVVGSLDSHDDVCADLCAASSLDVVSIDYRLSPEHHHPAAFEDCQSVLDCILGTGRPVILAGDSAGGNLAAALAHFNRRAAILGQVLIYPGLGGNKDRGSYLVHANAPMLTLADLHYYADVHSGGDAPLGDPTYAPLQDTDFSDLPPTVAIAAECDPLADDAVVYAECITSAGGKALAITEAGLVHGYLRARHSVERARTSFERIKTAIAMLGNGQMPSAGDLAG